MLINYIADPYNVFDSKYINLYTIPVKYAHVSIKNSKNITADTLVMGSSNTMTLFDNKEFYAYYFNLLCQNQMNYKQQYFLLKNYLHFHPETKTVFLFITYSAFWYEKGFFLKEDTFHTYNLQEIIFLLLSIDSTKKSLGKIKQEGFKNILKRHFNKKDNDLLFLDEKDLTSYQYYPNAIPDFHVDKSEHIKIKEENIEYLIKIIKLLKEKNIETRIIIPPHHAIMLAVIDELPHVRETVDYVKKLCVNLTDNDIYDFAVINKYTTVELNNKNYIFQDMLHANLIMGLKIFRAIHDNITEQNLYVKLNKQNIDEEIKKQHEQVKEFEQNNKPTVMKYFNFYRDNPNTDTMEAENVQFENAPQYFKKELNEYKEKYKKINKLNFQGKPIKRGIFENQI